MPAPRRRARPRTTQPKLKQTRLAGAVPSLRPPPNMASGAGAIPTGSPTGPTGVLQPGVQTGLPGAVGPRPPVAPAAPVAPPAPPLAGPTAPAGPVDPWAPMAGDSAATLAGLGLQRSLYDSGLAGISASEGALLRDFGVVEDQAGGIKDPATGRVFRIDIAGNPYSKWAQLKRDFDARKESNVNQGAGRGFLFDGSFGAITDRTNQAEGQAQHDLTGAFTGGLQGLAGQRADLFNAAMAAILGYRADDADRAAATIPDLPGTPPPPKPAGNPGPAVSSSAQPKSKPPGKPKDDGKRGKVVGKAKTNLPGAKRAKKRGKR